MGSPSAATESVASQVPWLALLPHNSATSTLLDFPDCLTTDIDRALCFEAAECAPQTGTAPARLTRQIAFIDPLEHMLQLVRDELDDVASSKNKVLAELGERVGLGLAVSPNGRTIVLTRSDSPSSDLMMVENFR